MEKTIPGKLHNLDSAFRVAISQNETSQRYIYNTFSKSFLYKF